MKIVEAKSFFLPELDAFISVTQTGRMQIEHLALLDATDQQKQEIRAKLTEHIHATHPGWLQP